MLVLCNPGCFQLYFEKIDGVTPGENSFLFFFHLIHICEDQFKRKCNRYKNVFSYLTSFFR